MQIETLHIIGYASAILVGITLGLIGAGGSILTVPIMVYLFGINNTQTATMYSLFVVGIASAFGVRNNLKKGLVDLKTAAIFGAPAILAIVLTRKVFMPILPTNLWQFDQYTLTKDMLVLVTFSILMILAAFGMIRGRKDHPFTTEKQEVSGVKVGIQGYLVGTMTGFVGAGGGFLIIPALIKLFKLPVKKAVGTSMILVTVNSLIGFVSDLPSPHLSWSFLLLFSSIAIVGIFIGTYLSNYIPGNKLKPAFGWFVLATGIFILGNSIIN